MLNMHCINIYCCFKYYFFFFRDFIIIVIPITINTSKTTLAINNIVSKPAPNFVINSISTIKKSFFFYNTLVL